MAKRKPNKKPAEATRAATTTYGVEIYAVRRVGRKITRRKCGVQVQITDGRWIAAVLAGPARLLWSRLGAAVAVIASTAVLVRFVS